MKRKRYKYYADYDGGHLLADSLEELCKQVNKKFFYLNTPRGTKELPWTKDELIEHNTVFADADYIRRNVFGKGRSGYVLNLLNSDAFCMGYDHWLLISRYEL